jgi:hypothetical protein
MDSSDMVTLSIEVFGEKAINRELMGLSERVADAIPAFENIAELFYMSEKQQFSTEGMWASGGWLPLKPATVAVKANHPGWSTMILQRTGAMMESLTHGDSDYSVKVITPEYMEVASSVPYGVYHQQPKGPGKGVIPMRKPVELPDGIKVDMVKILQRWIKTGKVLGL